MSGAEDYGCYYLLASLHTIKLNKRIYNRMDHSVESLSTIFNCPYRSTTYIVQQSSQTSTVGVKDQ